MDRLSITFGDPTIQQLVEDWANDKGFVATDQLVMHLEERFQVAAVHVVAAISQGGFLILRLTTDRWQEPREFGLLSNGSLTW
jgi:hypothetical protein